MKISRKKEAVASIILAVLTLGLAFSLTIYVKSENLVKSMEEDISKLHLEIETKSKYSIELESEIEIVNKENKELNSEVKLMSEDIESKDSAIKDLREDSLNNESKIKQLEILNSNLEKKLNTNAIKKSSNNTQKKSDTSTGKTSDKNGGGVGVSRSNGYRANYQMTHYTAFCDTGCTGVTASGHNVSNSIYYQGYRIVAAPSNIALYTKLRIYYSDGSKVDAIVLDRGGAIKGGIIDLLVSSNSEARNLGRKQVQIEILK